MSDDANMSRRSRRAVEEHEPEKLEGWLDVMWAVVFLQGSILVATSLESLVINIGTGFAIAPILLFTSLAAFVTLMTAKGLRRRRSWARRVTIVTEWLVLVVGAAEVVATVALAGTAPQLMPVAVTVVMPIAVLVGIRRIRVLFPEESEAKPTLREDEVTIDGSLPRHHSMLGPIA